MIKKEKYKSQYKHLKQEQAFEKKLSMRTIEVLENKVSSLLADNGQLKNSNIQLDKVHKESNFVVSEMSEELEQLKARVAVLEIDNQFLEKCVVHKERDNHISFYDHESVKSELQITKSQLFNMQSKLSILENEKQLLQSSLNNLKVSVEWANIQTEMTYKATLDVLEERFSEIKQRVKVVQVTLDDAMMYSNKTLYLEEVNVLKQANAALLVKKEMLDTKLAMLNKVVGNP